MSEHTKRHLNMLIVCVITFAIVKSCHGLELYDLSIYATKAVGTNRHWSVPIDETKKGELGVDLGFNVYKHKLFRAYTDLKINGMYTDQQFRYVALDAEVGLNIMKSVEVFAGHRSEHALDYKYTTLDKYPNTNSVGIRLNFLGGSE